MKKSLGVAIVLAFIITLTLVPGAFAASLDDIPDNVLRIGNDFYSMDSVNLSDENILASLAAGNYAYIKINGYWYNIFTLSDDQVGNPEFAESEEALQEWTGLDTWFKSGTETEEVVTTPSDQISGTYLIEDKNTFTQQISLSIYNLDEAAYYNVYKGDNPLANESAAINQPISNVKAMFSDPGALLIKFYSDMEGENLIATATLGADNELLITMFEEPPYPTGTYVIEDFNNFSDSVSINVLLLDNAAFFNVFREGTALANAPVAINEKLVAVSAMLKDTSFLEVELYSDAEGENLVATATLQDGTLVIELQGASGK